MNMESKKLGVNLKRIRTEKGMSQADLCRELGVDKSSISNIESGKQNPTLATIKRIADALDVSIDKLMIERCINTPTFLDNKTGFFELAESGFFFKVMDKQNFIKERDGYKKISKYFPVPKLIYASPSVKEKGLLIFEYENTIGKNRGLLVDKFAHEEKFDKDFKIILDLYRDVFLKTLKKDEGVASHIFFKDRVENRLSNYYKPSFIKRDFDFNINGRKISGDLSKIFKSIKLFFKNQNRQWCIVSQCDPNDLNIGTKPIIFDYTAGGSVPLMAEFATFFWYQLAQGSYLSLKYNSKAFVGHEDIYKKMDHVELKGKKLIHTASNLRIIFIQEYIKHVIKPCFEKISAEETVDWYEQFKNYLAMKILGVFNVSKMCKKDQLLSIGYLHLFYNSRVASPEHLMRLINFKK